MELLRSALDSVVERWESYAPEFSEAVALLTALASARWDAISTKDLYTPLKRKLLSEYSESAWSDDFVALVEQGLGWHHRERRDLNAAQAAFSKLLTPRLLGRGLPIPLVG